MRAGPILARLRCGCADRATTADHGLGRLQRPAQLLRCQATRHTTQDRTEFTDRSSITSRSLRVGRRYLRVTLALPRRYPGATLALLRPCLGAAQVETLRTGRVSARSFISPPTNPQLHYELDMRHLPPLIPHLSHLVRKFFVIIVFERSVLFAPLF